ncbi:hypothetical protein [Streptomyces sp. NPDC041003]|uniref:HEAT repeat domain-containing protein n=1 Tax=Streptomyces sp. NPDC041003 TaxID=3155730 RepID=UPI0033FFDA82
MSGYRSPEEWVESAWQELDAPDTGRRDSCLEVVCDVLETGRLAQADAERAIERLVAVALSDESHTLRESALHAICTATTPYELPYRVVEPLAAGVDGFEPLLLGYVLAVLGSTDDRAVLPVVERFLRHHHPYVRSEAADAVNELRRLRESPGEGAA